MKFGTVLTVCHVMVTMVTCPDIDDFVPQNVQKMFSVLSQSKMVDTPPRARSAGTPVGPLVALREDLDTCRADVARLKNRLKNLSTQVSSSPDVVQMSVPVEGHCPKPVAPEYGHVDYSSTMVGATANIVCDDNYTYLGQGSQITCTASGAWKSYTDERGQCYESTWTNPAGNFTEALPYYLMAGTRISILGQCTDTDKFTIAFEDLTTDRKVLAMDVDMSTRTARRYHEVADMAADDTWSTFPFTAGQTFNITLSVLVDNIRILVGDQEMTLCEYKTQALRLASHVTIHGGITVEQVDLIYP